MPARLRNPARHWRNGPPTIEGGHSLWWLIALGALACMGLILTAMYEALNGRDPGRWGASAFVLAMVVAVGTALMPALTKQAPEASTLPGTPSARRAALVSVASLWTALYVLVISNIQELFVILAWPRWAILVAAIAAMAPIGAVIYALARYVMRAGRDEYQRALLMRAALIASGLTFFTMTAWGLFELYVGAPRLPLALTLAPFCLFFAIANWWIRGRR